MRPGEPGAGQVLSGPAVMFLEAISHAPRDFNSSRNLTVSSNLENAHDLADEQFAAAVRQFREVLEAAPNLEVARSQLAKALRAEGQIEAADRVYLDLARPSISKQN
jgi:Tfp pilus assembly protein PilF